MRPFSFACPLLLLLLLVLTAPLVLWPAAPARAQRLEARPFPAFGGMALLGRWQLADTLELYSDIWGYAAPDGREYAIIGGNAGTSFVDVTTPTAPRLVATLPGRASSRWRDFKTWGAYAYAVADAGPHSLQVFDLHGLPDTVRVAYDSDSLLTAAHTCFVENGRLYAVSAKYYVPGEPDLVWADVLTFDLTNPARPRRIGIFRVDSVGAFAGRRSHAVFVRRDTLYLSTGQPDLRIYAFQNPNRPRLVGRVQNYAFGGYNHSSWTTPNGRLGVVADEVPNGLPLKLFDLSHPFQPQLLATFNSTAFTTPHNPYFVGNRYIVASAYHDGVQVWEVATPTAPRHLGGFDTRPENDTSLVGYSGYRGCWGVYPFLPSGNLIASDIERGLFVLAPPYPVPVLPLAPVAPFNLWPNPARTTETLTLALPPDGPIERLTLEITDATGRRVRSPLTWHQPAPALKLPPLALAPGLYWLRLSRPNAKPQLRRLIVTN